MVALLLTLWLAATFVGGGYRPIQWLLPAVMLAIVGLVASAFAFYPRRPRQLSMAVLLLFGGYVVWLAVSAAWSSVPWADAPASGAAWTAAVRAGLYLLMLALAMTYLTHHRARLAFRRLLVGAGLAVVLLCVWRLSRNDSMPALFRENRLLFPLMDPNHAAALFLVLFWPVLWVAGDPAESVPIRGVALGVTCGLVLLAALTASRGAMWSLAATVLLVFLLSPARLRSFTFLVVPVALLVWSFPDLNSHWRLGPRALLGTAAVHKVLGAMLVASAVGMVLALLEGWIPVRRPAKVTLGTILLLAVATGCAYGAVSFQRDVGRPMDWTSATWQRFTAGQTTVLPGWQQPPPTRLVTISANGRWESWKTASAAFLAAPWEVHGAGLYDPPPTSTDAQRASSTALHVLSESGVVGGVLLFGSLTLGLGGLLVPRFAAGWRGARSTWLRRRGRRPADLENAATQGALPDPATVSPGPLGRPRAPSHWGTDPREYGWEFAIAMAVVYWLIHGAVEWLWQVPAVTLSVLLMLAAGLAGVDSRAGAVWPRWGRWLRGLGARLTRRTQIDVGGTGRMAPDVELATDESDTAGSTDQSFNTYRRADRHARRQRRRERLGARRERLRATLQPPGHLSALYRWGLGLASLGMAGTLTYMYLRFLL